LHIIFKIIAGIVISIILLIVGGVAAYFAYDFERGKGKFDYATGVVVDKSGNIYVIDTSNSRIQKFDSNGELMLIWRSDGSRLAVDSADNIYSINADTQHVTKYTNYGLQIQVFKYDPPAGTRGAVGDVAIDSRGNVYWTVPFESKIRQASPDGKTVTEWDSQLRLEGDAVRIYLESMSIDSHDNLYVMAGFNNAQFTRIYSEIAKFKIIAPEEDYECDAENKVASNVCFVTKWRTDGSRGIGVDSHGFVYAAAGSKVKQFTEDGVFVKEIGSIDVISISDIAIDFDDYLYAVDYTTNHNQVVKFTRDGEIIQTFGSTWHYHR
jgi:tripartite motif-containing protein 71